MMTSDIGMFKEEETSPEMFLEPFPKGPCRFLYVLLITLQLVTLIPVCHCTLLCDVFLVPRDQQGDSNEIASLEMDLDPQFATYVLETCV